MVFIKRHLVFCSFVLLLLSVSGIIFASVAIVSNDCMGKRACKQINTGMTQEQVNESLEILEGQLLVLSRLGGPGGCVDHYLWEDGSTTMVGYWDDGIVHGTSEFQESQETLWAKLRRLIKDPFTVVVTWYLI